ncbi:hypothetical protein ABZ502_25980 [Streptomyces abikoensis]|uniref:hypothetical protein n=1 Tax=Streptomyces abikoensis TaxID=97398 RepID=UPI0033CDEDE0
MNAGTLGATSRVLWLEARRPVHLSVHREGGEVVLTGDGVVRRPHEVRATPVRTLSLGTPAACPYRTETTWIAVGAYVCAEPR